MSYNYKREKKENEGRNGTAGQFEFKLQEVLE